MRRSWISIKTKLASQKPPTLGSQLNSAGARVKKASLRKKKLEETIQEAQKGMQENEEELRMAIQQLEEVKSALKGENPSQVGANARAQSAEPAVADVTAGVCKELAQILTTLQLSMEVSETDSQASRGRDKGKDRSRSNSRGRSEKGPPSNGKDANVVGMKAAIARICVLGQQLEALQISAAPPAAPLATGKGDGKGKMVEPPEQPGEAHNASKGTGGHDKPKGDGIQAMDVEPLAPVAGDTPHHSAQSPGPCRRVPEIKWAHTCVFFLPFAEAERSVLGAAPAPFPFFAEAEWCACGKNTAEVV
eukprot:1109792-Amphidinium_carterae.1